VDPNDKRELIRSTWQLLLVENDLEGALRNFTEEVEWWVCGSLPGIAGVKKGKQGIRDWFAGGSSNIFPKGLNTEVRYSHVDGDTVIAEMHNYGEVANGRIYDNYYCFVFELRDGRIDRVREYVDSYTVQQAMGDLLG
jgi:ketosteroid isomerase-like protein